MQCLNDLIAYGKQEQFHANASAIVEHLVNSYHEAYAEEIKQMYESKLKQQKDEQLVNN